MLEIFPHSDFRELGFALDMVKSPNKPSGVGRSDCFTAMKLRIVLRIMALIIVKLVYVQREQK